MEILCNAVFEGGGMRGIGHVGAIKEFEEAGYKFNSVAGTSAGAIVASLLAAGYNANELHTIMSIVNFEKFKHANHWYSNVGRTGGFFSVVRNLGIYSADLFEDWLTELLLKKNIRTFADLKIQLKVIAANITEQRILVLPDDLARFGIDPTTFSVATAVRMSMSIPIFYEPFELRDTNGNLHLIADGGILSNYPVWVLDDGFSAPDIPTFGFRFTREHTNATPTRPNLLTYIKQILHTVMDDEDVFFATIQGDHERTTFISPKIGNHTISAIDFDLPSPQIEALYQNGRLAAQNFLSTWNFENWKQTHRIQNLTPDNHLERP